MSHQYINRQLNQHCARTNEGVGITVRLLILLPLILLAGSCSQDTLETPLTFDGSSRELKATVVVPTLHTPIPDNRSAIWCASFNSAWKALQDLAGEPISLEQAPEAGTLLNEAPDSRTDVPETNLVALAGWNQRGVIEDINKALHQKFPDKNPISFPGMEPGSFVAYAYLEVTLGFPVPYFQNKGPLMFVGEDGRPVEVKSFGISSEREYNYRDLGKQPRLLFQKEKARIPHKPPADEFEFAIDLCANSSPSQIVVARIVRQPTLAENLAYIRSEIDAFSGSVTNNSDIKSAPEIHGANDEVGQPMGSDTVLLVPDLSWQVIHHFREIEGRRFKNQKLDGQRIDIAEEDILFRLNRKGAELKAESKLIKLGLAVRRTYMLNRPFLIYMKKRGAKTPYFAMWVDNAELLCPWSANKESH